MVILSILIPTIKKRRKMFTVLFNEIMKQRSYMQTFHDSLGEIEILVDSSDAYLDGGLSIGKKREALVRRATGKYLCFLDDDEDVSPDYLETLVRMAQSDKDVLTFRNISKFDNFWMIVDMSLSYVNQQARPGTTYRKPWHINPVRSIFAKAYPFPDINYGEDWTWFSQVLSNCETEEHSESIIHEYRHSKMISEADKITRYEMVNKSI